MRGEFRHATTRDKHLTGPGGASTTAQLTHQRASAASKWLAKPALNKGWKAPTLRRHFETVENQSIIDIE